MKTRGKRCAVLITLAGVGVILAATVLLRDPIWWWWRGRGMVEVLVVNLEGSVTLTSREAVSNALRETRKLVSTLADAGDKYDDRVLRETFINTSVEFRRIHGPDVEADLRLYYYRMGERSGCLSGFDGRAYECPLAAWDQYLRTILEPAVPTGTAPGN